MRSYAPLPADHWAVTDESQLCAVCHKRFKAGDVTTLIPVDPLEQGGTVPALLAHTRCVMELTA